MLSERRVASSAKLASPSSKQFSIDGLQSLNCFVDPTLGRQRPRACAALAELLAIAGWSSKFVNDPSAADLAYGSSSVRIFDLPFAGADAWALIGDSRPIAIRGVTQPSRAAIATTRARELVDPVLSTDFYLRGLPERFARAETKGIPDARSSEWGLFDVPAVQANARALRARLAACGFPAPRPAWPAGKTWALCLSHDCDQPTRFRPIGYARDALRAARQAAPRLAAGCAAKAVYCAAARFRDDPFLRSWNDWMRFESSLGIRATYYVATWNRYDRRSDSRDVPYAVKDPRIRSVVAGLLDGGWEVGLHSSIDAWRDGGRFEEEAHRFERAFGTRPRGMRGHFWSLDPSAPERTLALARAQAAIDYDSSLGMDLVQGFRRGVAYPFRPYDDNGQGSGVWEIPPTVMDWALYLSGPDTERRCQVLRARAKGVAACGGLLVLDWHEYTLAPGVMSDLAEGLLHELAEFAADSSCWIATAAQIVDWCSHARWMGR